MTTPSAPVKILIFAKKKETMTKEEFDEYWRGPHAKRFMEFELVKKHCLRYEQVRAEPNILGYYPSPDPIMQMQGYSILRS